MTRIQKTDPAPGLTPPVKHLLVDLDGTLLGNRNISLSFDFAAKALTTLKGLSGWRKATHTLLSINKIFKTVSKDTANDLRVVNLFSKEMKISPEEGRKLLKEALGVIFPGLKKHFYPIAGAKEFLDWAKDHYPLTLATNPVWPPEIIQLRVQWAGIDPSIFRFVTHVKTMHACKPTPEYYEEILSLQNLKAVDCLLIGNETKMDLPATRVGIRTFIVGPYKKLIGLEYPKAIAQGWRGSFTHLQKLLENSQ